MAGASLSICNAGGTSAPGNGGAIQVTGPRSFPPEATYYYDSPDPPGHWLGPAHHRAVPVYPSTAASLLSVGGRAPAQAPGSTGPMPSAAGPTEVPLDGGASLLLASGVAYGLKRRRAGCL